MISSSIYHCLTNLSLILMYASASCVRMLCVLSLSTISYFFDIWKVSGNKNFDEPQSFTAAKLIYIRLYFSYSSGVKASLK